jgi:hypothetical protein
MEQKPKGITEYKHYLAAGNADTGGYRLSW